MTIAKTVCGYIALALFLAKVFNIKLGTLDLIAAGLFFLGIAILPI